MKAELFLELSKDVDSIIFDYGGIFIDIDYDRTVQALSKLSKSKDVSVFYTKHKQVTFFSDFEIGKISAGDFLKILKNELEIDAQDKIVRDAWNAMLLGIRVERIKFLQELAKNKRVFLLSNINKIHEDYLEDYISSQPGLKGLYGNFEKIYFSHQVGLRKPNREIYDLVLEENSLLAERTLFIDDSSQHVEGAKNAGLKALLLDPPNTFIVSRDEI
jgi:glucose-1-phosphatase